MSEQLPARDSRPRLVSPMTALVVEHDPVLRQFLRRLLERNGLDVLLASSAEQALMLIAREADRLDVIVHGEELLRGDEGRVAARFGRLTPERPVVLYGGSSARPSLAGRHNGRAPSSPFDAEVLVRSILAAVRGPSNDAD
jgi:DNA-binding NtrC family response regulator